MQQQKIPATVISGFLGAGKTSLIRNLLGAADGRRIALIINEFGDLGVDRDLLQGCGDEVCADGDIVELANGCICCTVADEFLPVMEALLERDNPPEHIVIETSGLALPKPLVAAFNWPEIRHRVTVDGVVAVVDGPAFHAGRFADDPDAVQAARAADEMLDHENPLAEVFEDQIACADLIIVNKVDQLSAPDHAQVRSSISAASRDGVSVVSAEHANVPLAVVLGLDAKAEEDLAARPTHHDGPDADHEHDDFESFTLDLGAIPDLDAFEARAREAATSCGVLRMKGFLDVPGKQRRHVVQAVGNRIDRYYDRDWRTDETRASRLVVIGERPLDRSAIERIIAG